MYSLAKIWMPTKVGKYENTRKLMRRIEIERTFARCWCRQVQTVETVRWEVVTEFGPGAVEPSPTWFAVTVANRRWYSALTLTFLLGTKSWLCFCVRPSLDDVFAGWQNKRRGVFASIELSAGELYAFLVLLRSGQDLLTLLLWNNSDSKQEPFILHYKSTIGKWNFSRIFSHSFLNYRNISQKDSTKLGQKNLERASFE